MRKVTMVALTAVLVLGATACGGGDDKVTADPDATDDGGATTDDGGGGDGATDAAVAGLLDEDCQFLLAGAYLNPLAALTPGGDADVDEASAQLEAIADNAPEEIQDAMATLSQAYAEMAEALEGVDLQDPQSFSDPEVQAAFQELESTFDEDYEQAGQVVSDYIAENCSG